MRHAVGLDVVEADVQLLDVVLDVGCEGVLEELNSEGGEAILGNIEMDEAHVVPETLAKLKHSLIAQGIALQVQDAEWLIHLEELLQVAGALVSHVVRVARVAVAEAKMDERLIESQGLEQACGPDVRQTVLRKVKNY